MRPSSLLAAIIFAFICALPANAQQAPSAPQMSSAIVQACGDSAEITLDAEPVRLDLKGLKGKYPGLGSIVEGYRFRWALDASYRLGDAADSTCLTVLRMKGPLDAFGPFSLQRSKEASPVPVPTSAYWLSNGLHVWRGEYYVRACIPPGGPAAQQKAIELVTKIMSKIPAPDALPALLEVLPWNARQVSRPKYERHNVLGLAFLHNGVTVEYTEGETKCTLVLMRYGTEQETSKAYDSLLSTLAANQSAVEPVAQMGDAASRFHSARYRQCMTMREGKFLALVLDYHDPEFAEELLRATGTEIRTYLLAGG